MISVIIAAKDCEKWLPETLSSLENQTFKDWNCFISMNGSSDKTLNIAKNAMKRDSRFLVLESEIPNKSLAVNRAIIASKRDWIAILDADDLWHPKKLEIQVARITDDVDVLGTQMQYIDASGNSIQNTPSLPLLHEECISFLSNMNNPIANSSVLYRRKIHDEVGYYNPEFLGVEDYDMWMRSKRAGVKFMNVSDVLLYHRIHATSNFNVASKQQVYKSLVDQIDAFLNV